jgi:hypothetical protein
MASRRRSFSGGPRAHRFDDPGNFAAAFLRAIGCNSAKLTVRDID